MRFAILMGDRQAIFQVRIQTVAVWGGDCVEGFVPNNQMTFAISFIVFFVIDILIFHQFLLFGMAPVDNLCLAVGFYTGVTYFQNKAYYPSHQKWGIVYVGSGFIILNNLLAAFPMYLMMMPNTNVQRVAWLLSGYPTGLSFGATAVVFSILIFQRKISDRLYQWLVFSIGILFINKLINLIFSPTPPLLYRYQGFLILPAIFAWLMMLHHIFEIKYGNIDEITEEMAPSYREELNRTESRMSTKTFLLKARLNHGNGI